MSESFSYESCEKLFEKYCLTRDHVIHILEE